MRSFLAKHQYLVIWISGLLIIGALTELVIQLNGSFLPTSISLNQPAPVVQTPPPPPAPSVSLTIEQNGKKSSLYVQWQNLPDGTTALNIFRGKSGTSTSTWTLWKTITIPPGQGSGSAQFDLGLNDQGYQYYVQAVSDNGDNSSSTQVLWESNPSDPGTASSTNAGGGNNGTNGNNNSTSTSQNNNNTSTQQTNNNNNSSTQSGNNGNTSTGTPGNAFYNPQIQITGYGTAKGSFWVEHVNQSIEVGWQNLPANTDSITFFRSQNQDGPWNQFLRQQNPGTTGSYSLQLVDGTLNEAYYYEMVAGQGSTSSDTYGPIYLPPANGQ